MIFFKVRELIGNLQKCQGNLELFANVRELSGNFNNVRFKSSYLVIHHHPINVIGAIIKQIVSRSAFNVELSSHCLVCFSN